MMCPKCYSSLIPREQKRVQSLSEHVCDPNGEPSMKQLYGCLNKDCACYIDNIRWTIDGERYGGKYDIDYKFEGDNDAPFGTIWRRINAEHKEKLVLNVNLYFIKWRIKEKYIANEWGTTLKRYWKLETFMRKENGLYAYYHSGIHMLIYCIGCINRLCEAIKENPDTTWHKKELNEHAEYKSWWPKTDWWRWVAMWYARFRLWK